MPESSAEKILDHIPKRTPVWAIGLTTLIVSTCTCALTIYLFARTEIQQYMGWAEEHHNTIEMKELEQHEKVDIFRGQQYSDALAVVAKLVTDNGTSITDIAKSLGQTQQQNIVLNDRIALLEKEVREIKNGLSDCHKALTECEKRIR